MMDQDWQSDDISNEPLDVSTENNHLTRVKNFYNELQILRAMRLPYVHNIGSEILPPLCGLTIDGIGLVPLPIDDLYGKIIRQTLQSTKNKNMNDNKSGFNENCIELESEKVHFTHPLWNNSISRVVKEVAEQFGIDPSIVKAKLKKLRMFEPGAMTVPSRKTKYEKLGKSEFATLLIQLPSYVKGGDIEISFYDNDKSSRVLKFANDLSAFECQYIAYYDDCKLQAEDIKSGYKLDLIYTLSINPDNVANIPLSNMDTSQIHVPLSELSSRRIYQRRHRVQNLLNRFNTDESMFCIPISDVRLSEQEKEISRLIIDTNQGSWQTLVVQVNAIDVNSEYYDPLIIAQEIVSVFNGDGHEVKHYTNWLQQNLDTKFKRIFDGGMVLASKNDEFWVKGLSSASDEPSNGIESDDEYFAWRRQSEYKGYFLVVYSVHSMFKHMLRFDFKKAVVVATEQKFLLPKLMRFLKPGKNLTSLECYNILRAQNAEKLDLFNLRHILAKVLDCHPLTFIDAKLTNLLCAIYQKHGLNDTTQVIINLLNKLSRFSIIPHVPEFVMVVDTNFRLCKGHSDANLLDSLNESTTINFEAQTSSQCGISIYQGRRDYEYKEALMTLTNFVHAYGWKKNRIVVMATFRRFHKESIVNSFDLLEKMVEFIHNLQLHINDDDFKTLGHLILSQLEFPYFQSFRNYSSCEYVKNVQKILLNIIKPPIHGEVLYTVVREFFDRIRLQCNSINFILVRNDVLYGLQQNRPEIDLKRQTRNIIEDLIVQLKDFGNDSNQCQRFMYESHFISLLKMLQVESEASDIAFFDQWISNTSLENLETLENKMRSADVRCNLYYKTITTTKLLKFTTLRDKLHRLEHTGASWRMKNLTRQFRRQFPDLETYLESEQHDEKLIRFQGTSKEISRKNAAAALVSWINGKGVKRRREFYKKLGFSAKATLISRTCITVQKIKALQDIRKEDLIPQRRELEYTLNALRHELIRLGYKGNLEIEQSIPNREIARDPTDLTKSNFKEENGTTSETTTREVTIESDNEKSHKLELQHDTEIKDVVEIKDEPVPEPLRKRARPISTETKHDVQDLVRKVKLESESH